MRFKFVVSAALFLCFSGPALATSVGLNLGDDTAEFNVSQKLDAQELDDMRVGGSLLFNDNDDFVGSGYLQVIGDLRPGFSALKYGAGFKAYVADLDGPDTTFGAVGLGGLVRLDIPQVTVPMAVVLEGYFAPEITTAGRGEGVLDLTARFELRFARSATAYVGYRYLEFEVDRFDDYEVDDDFLIGLRLSF